MTTTTEAGLIGESDERQLAFAHVQGRVLVSHDADMLRFAAGGAPHAGVAYCHHRKYPVGALILKLMAFASRVRDNEMISRIEFL